ncbi:putative guanine deaminase [Grifola frondosa]|uniref:Putative guanine deaminase n=1 Tax=Grifola frondosa TaxID=5627 RepID=A0A1C7LXY7_GRIFR|nr:putative guanine deaminase [Grifola frondosa]
MLAQHGVASDAELIRLKMGEFLMPGFIDTHIHAPQAPILAGMFGQEHELLDWLSEVTFPMESRFSDVGFARRAYKSIIRRTIDYGSTTCCYYGTLHLESTKALAEIVHAYGQRAFVGKCNMDQNSPDYYIEPSAEASLAATRELIAHIRAIPRTHSALVQPILTPRFAMSARLRCSPGSRAAASDPALAIQTHISETSPRSCLRSSSSPRNPSPRTRTRSRYAGLWDCTSSRRSGDPQGSEGRREPLPDEQLQPAQRVHQGRHAPRSRIKVGLGTDVSGGFSPSVLAAIQHASMCSKVVAMQNPPADGTGSRFTNRPLPVATLLHLATLGGAEVCNLESRIGSLAPGKAFDALVSACAQTRVTPRFGRRPGHGARRTRERRRARRRRRREDGEKELEECWNGSCFVGMIATLGRCTSRGG